MITMFMKGVGAYGRLHSLLWLDVLKDLEGAFHIHQCPAQQKGSSVRRWIDLQFTFVEAEHGHDHEHLQVMKDSQLFLVVAVLLAMDITIMTTWQLADPFYRETRELKPYVRIIIITAFISSSWLQPYHHHNHHNVTIIIVIIIIYLYNHHPHGTCSLIWFSLDDMDNSHHGHPFYSSLSTGTQTSSSSRKMRCVKVIGWTCSLGSSMPTKAYCWSVIEMGMMTTLVTTMMIMVILEIMMMRASQKDWAKCFKAMATNDSMQC